jgi:hypothetical protein
VNREEHEEHAVKKEEKTREKQRGGSPAFIHLSVFLRVLRALRDEAL